MIIPPSHPPTHSPNSCIEGNKTSLRGTAAVNESEVVTGDLVISLNARPLCISKAPDPAPNSQAVASVSIETRGGNSDFRRRVSRVPVSNLCRVPPVSAPSVGLTDPLDKRWQPTRETLVPSAYTYLIYLHSFLHFRETKGERLLSAPQPAVSISRHLSLSLNKPVSPSRHGNTTTTQCYRLRVHVAFESSLRHTYDSEQLNRSNRLLASRPSLSLSPAYFTYPPIE